MLRKYFIAILTITIFSGGFFAARLSEGNTAQAQENAPFPLEQLREFSEIFRIVKDKYVDEISDKELMENAIRGMIQGLDPHSNYLTAASLENFEKSISAEEYGGLGIYIGEKDEWIEVISPIDDTPASRAGILPGDLILKIDSVNTNGMGIDAAVTMMRGKIGHIIVLEVLTRGDEQPRTVELRREKIVAPSVVASLSEKDYGYLRLNRFQRQTVGDAIKNINKLYAENERPLKGLVLDLRNNPGGLLGASVAFAGIFLPEGVTVVSDRDRTREQHFTVKAAHHRGLQNIDEVKNLHMVVLVNDGSASASEIVAGALQDHKRAVIMGSTTYGKGSVQTLLHLRSTRQKTGIKLTTARYFTPANRSIQAVGITPDIAVARAKSITADSQFSLREKDLADHLENSQQQANEDEKSKDEEAIIPFIPQDDHQYDQALVVLKALSLVN
ncbi:MAG: S41 family peptidase [Gammaproteobacteria bacterium WSBS_2016_MAG_OTU1]